MKNVYMKTVLKKLEELSDRSIQGRLWLSDGSSGEVSSFEEACCGLFNDSGLIIALERGETGLPEDVNQKLRELDTQLERVDERYGMLPDEPLIQVPEMVKVRQLAAEALALIRRTLPEAPDDSQ